MNLPLPLTLALVDLTSVTVGHTDAVPIGVVTATLKIWATKTKQHLKTAWAVVTKIVFQPFPLDELGEQKVPLGNCATP